MEHNMILEVILGGILVLAGWTLLTVQQTKNKVTAISTELFGITGANGMKSEMKELKKSLGHVQDRLEELSYDVTKLNSSIHAPNRSHKS